MNDKTGNTETFHLAALQIETFEFPLASVDDKDDEFDTQIQPIRWISRPTRNVSQAPGGGYNYPPMKG